MDRERKQSSTKWGVDLASGRSTCTEHMIRFKMNSSNQSLKSNSFT
jgi:hypothetical protein